MTALPEHPATGQLALLALCGDLVIAIEAMAIQEIRRAEETAARAADRGVTLLELAGGIVPGWDLGELLGIAAAADAWVIVELPGVHRRVGLRVGRCVMVQSLPVCRAIPRGIFASGATGRQRAMAAAFSTAAVPELEDHVSGVVIDLAHVLGESELASLARLGEEGRDSARPT